VRFTISFTLRPGALLNATSRIPSALISPRFSRELNPPSKTTLDAAYHAHPERFPNGQPRARLPPDAVHINPIFTRDGNGVLEAVEVTVLPAIEDRVTPMITALAS